MSLLAFWMKWHRRAGLFIAPIILMLAVTGILINHSQQLGWFEQPVYSKTIGLLYGVKAEAVLSGYPILPIPPGSSKSQQWAIQNGDQLLLDTRPVGHCSEALKGALTWDSMLTFLCGNELLFFTEAGELVEQMFDLPDAHYLGISEATGQLVLSSRPRRESSEYPAPDCSRAVCHYLNPDLWQWQAAPSSDSGAATDTGLYWSSASQLPEQLSALLNRQQPLPGISLERVLLDLHSGRLFGTLGIWVVDLTGLLMILLVLSGAGTWGMRTLRRGRSKQTGRKENPRRD